MREIARNTKPVVSLPPAVRAASANGATVDRLGFEAVSFLVTTGAYTNGTHNISAEESDDGTTWRAVAAADLTTMMPIFTGAGSANTALIYGYIGDARYFRMVHTVTGSPATGMAVGGTVLLGRARQKPVA